MQRVSQGDEVAMGELYDRFIGLVFKASREVLSSRTEADDAVQETFIRLWQTADRFDPARAKLVTWVMLITRRHLIDRLRRRGARPEQLGLDGAAEFLGPTVEPAPEPGGSMTSRSCVAASGNFRNCSAWSSSAPTSRDSRSGRSASNSGRRSEPSRVRSVAA